MTRFVCCPKALDGVVRERSSEVVLGVERIRVDSAERYVGAESLGLKELFDVSALRCVEVCDDEMVAVLPDTRHHGKLVSLERRHRSALVGGALACRLRGRVAR